MIADNNIVLLAKAANIVVGRHVQNEKALQRFNLCHMPGQEKYMPISLLVLVGMVLNGTNIKTQLNYASIYLGVIVHIKTRKRDLVHTVNYIST